MISLVKLGKTLFPINRSLTGSGNLKTLKILKKHLPKLKIKYFKTNKKVYDWKIPSEYNVSNAYIEDKFGRKIIDFKKNNLHLVGYSTNVNKFINKNDLLNRIHTFPNDTKAIPYITSYYKKYWGFCLAKMEKDKIKIKYKDDDLFHVVIDSKFKEKGMMYYGEIIIPGKSKREILVSTYICHPSMANNELSGPLVTLAVANFFFKKKNKKTLRIIFVPETIGAIAYINKNYKNLRKIIGGYVLTCIGDEKNFSLLFSKYKNSISDIAAINAFKKFGIKFKKYSFLERGSDERQFNSPGVDLEISSIMKSKYGEYKEYHTSKDNFNIVTQKGLGDGFKIAKQSIINLMNTQIINEKRDKKINNPMSKYLCEPFLTKRNLVDTLSAYKVKSTKANFRKKLLDFLQYADGSNNLDQIGKFIKLQKKEVNKIFQICKKEKLIL